MGKIQQAPLGFDFFQAQQQKPAEVPVMLDIPKDRFHLGGTLTAQFFPLLRQQVFSRLLAKFPQTKAHSDVAIAFGAGALLLPGIVPTGARFVMAQFDRVAVIGRFVRRVAVAQALLGRTSELVAVQVVREIFS